MNAERRPGGDRPALKITRGGGIVAHLTPRLSQRETLDDRLVVFETRVERTAPCVCDRCDCTRGRIGWPDSEVRPTARRWLAFDVHRPLDVIAAQGPCSWSECEAIGIDPDDAVAA